MISKKNGERRYKYLVIRRNKSYFVHQKRGKTTLILTQNSLRQTSSKCSGLLFCFVDMHFNRQWTFLWVPIMFIFSPTLFAWSRLHAVASQGKRKKLGRFFNFTFRYIDDALSLNNSKFGYYVDRIYLIELEIKDTTCTTASCLDLYLEIKSDSWLRTKKDDFNGPIVKIYIK